MEGNHNMRQFDLAIAVDFLIPKAQYSDASTYDRLRTTWTDVRAIPSMDELTSNWNAASDAWDEKTKVVVKPFDALEKHFDSQGFGVGRMLKLKDLKDTLKIANKTSTKLEEVYVWQDGEFIKAAQNITNFSNTPHSFEDVITEVLTVLG
jgi:hypothetical protein